MYKTVCVSTSVFVFVATDVLYIERRRGDSHKDRKREGEDRETECLMNYNGVWNRIGVCHSLCFLAINGFLSAD